MRYNIVAMKKLTLYLETSIINAAIDDREPEKKKLTLRLFDEIKKEEYEVYVSSLVIDEIDKSSKEIAAELREAIKELNPEVLELDDEVDTLAGKYTEQGIIPVKYHNDALHIATATVNDLDVIVSWNFEHIVKLKTKREVIGINLLMGY